MTAIATIPELIQTEEIIESSGLSVSKIDGLKAVFIPGLEKIAAFKERAEAVQIADEFDKAGMKAARELRLEIKNERVNAEKARKQLKEEALREGKIIDSVSNIFKNLMEPLENQLEEKEKYAERIQAQREADLSGKRKSELEKYSYDAQFVDLGKMPEESYQRLLETARLAEERRLEAERQAEIERIEAERVEEERKAAEAKAEAERREAERVEMERIQAENKRLLEEAKAREDAERKALEERDAKRAKAAKVTVKKLGELGFTPATGGMHCADLNWFIGARHYSEFDTKEEFDSFMKDTKERLDTLVSAKAEAEKAAKIEAELQEARRKELERIAAEKARSEQQAAVEKAARLAPDKDKLNRLADELDSYTLPDLTSQEAKEILSNIRVLLGKTAKYARDKAETI